MSVYDDWINIVRREAQGIHFHGQEPSSVVCTSYDPSTYSIKGILVPHGVETDWIPIGQAHTGSGFGIVVGPKVGSSDALDGDQFHVQFEDGDYNSPMAVAKHFSVRDNPPQVQSGEILIQHESGAKFFADQNSNLTVGGSQQNQQVYLASDGSVLHQDSSGGQVYLSGGKVHLGSQSAAIPVMTESGPSTKVFAIM